MKKPHFGAAFLRAKHSSKNQESVRRIV